MMRKVVILALSAWIVTANFNTVLQAAKHFAYGNQVRRVHDSTKGNPTYLKYAEPTAVNLWGVEVYQCTDSKNDKFTCDEDGTELFENEVNNEPTDLSQFDDE